jgi:hypothetical protein
MPTDINTTKTRIARLLSEATPAPKTEQPKAYHTLWSLLGLSLIGTMLPFQTVVTFFSLTAVMTFSITLLLIWKKQTRISKPASGLLIALLTASMLSGCSPALFSRTSPEMLELIREQDYRYYTMEKYGIFGLGLDELTIENAQFEGNIETVYVAKLEQGYGIVSMSRITVAGK